jgi:hypothetical protein
VSHVVGLLPVDAVLVDLVVVLSAHTHRRRTPQESIHVTGGGHQFVEPRRVDVVGDDRGGGVVRRHRVDPLRRIGAVGDVLGVDARLVARQFEPDGRGEADDAGTQN